MDTRLLDLVHFRVQQILKCTNPLVKKKLILVGDHAQLPAVCRHELPEDEICLQCHISKSTIWSIGATYKLVTNVRHCDDQEFLDFLNITRIRQPSQEEIDRVLGPISGYTKVQVVLESDNESTVLCSHRDQVQSYNTEISRKLFSDSSSLESVPLLSNALEIPELTKWIEDKYFHTLGTVAVGAKVIVTKNIALDVAAANGATGIVTLLEHKGPGLLSAVGLRLSDTGKELSVHCLDIKHIYNNGTRFYKSSFPLVLGYALTGHKSQGATLRHKVFVDVKEAFCPGMLYVMLSRVPSRTNLRIVGRLTPEMFNPVKVPGFEH